MLPAVGSIQSQHRQTVGPRVASAAPKTLEGQTLGCLQQYERRFNDPQEARAEDMLEIRARRELASPLDSDES